LIRKLDQLETCPAREVRVDGQHFDAPSYNVGNGMPRSMVSSAKLQVADVVIRSRRELMVNRLGRQKLSSEKLLHDVAVFKDFTPLSTGYVREAKNDVAVSVDAPRYFAGFGGADTFIAGDQVLALKLTAARIAAGIGSAKTVTLYSERRSTHDAIFVVNTFTADVGALARAVERILTKLLVVLAKLPRVSAERISARLAGKLNGFDVVRRAAFSRKVIGVAGMGAKLPAVANILWRGCELFAAVSAGKRLALAVASVCRRVGFAACCGAELGVEVAADVAELLSAVTAGALSRRQALVVILPISAVVVVALSRAENAMGFLGSYGKRLAAVLAVESDRHETLLADVVQGVIYNALWGVSTDNIQGAV